VPFRLRASRLSFRIPDRRPATVSAQRCVFVFETSLGCTHVAASRFQTGLLGYPEVRGSNTVHGTDNVRVRNTCVVLQPGAREQSFLNNRSRRIYHNVAGNAFPDGHCAPHRRLPKCLTTVFRIDKCGHSVENRMEMIRTVLHTLAERF